MKKRIFEVIASLLLLVSTVYANQASALVLYNPKLPAKVKALRKF